MKKQMKKLTLAKETVRNLEGSELAVPVHGGLISTGFGSSCAAPCFYTNQPSCTC